MNIVLNPPFNPRSKRMGEEVGKIFVGGVNRETTPDAFRAYFEQYGGITDIVLMMDKDTGKNKGYGFVKYGDPVCVDSVMSKKGAHNLDGRTLDTKLCNARGAKPRGGRGQDDQRTKKVFVGGISQQATKEDLADVFSPHGMVEDVHIMTDQETGKHRGFGFVTFHCEEDVEKLVRLHYLELKGKSMEIKKALPKTNKTYGGPGQGQMGGGGFGGQGGGWNQGQPNFNDGMGGGFGGGGGGGNQWNMGQPMSQFGQQQGGFQQRGGAQGYGGQQGFNNGYRQQQQGGGGSGGYGQQAASTGGYGQQGAYGQQQQQTPQQQQSGYGKPNAAGDNYGGKSSGSGQQGYGSYGGYSQGQQDPYSQQSHQQYGNQAATPFGGEMGGQGYAAPQQQQQQQQPQQQQQQQPQQPQQQQQQSYGQPDAGQDMYGNQNYGRGGGNMGGNNQAFHPYRRFAGGQV